MYGVGDHQALAGFLGIDVDIFAVLLEQFSIVFEYFPAVHTRLPGPGPQEDNDVDVLESEVLLEVGVNLNGFDPDVATVLQLHFDDFQLGQFLLDLY